MSEQPTTRAPEASSSGALIVVGRALLLLLAVGAVVSAFVLGRGHDGEAGSFGGPYACPMHPEVTSRGPGECPVCRMALERVSAGRREAAATGPAVDSAAYSFPESADRPSYKLIANARRLTFAGTVRAPAWVEAGGLVRAILYEDELAGLGPGEPARFFRAALPAAGVEVRRIAGPPARWGPSTSRVDFRVAARAPALEAGDVGWVQLAARSRDLLAVPTSAVLVSSQGPYLLVAATDGRTFSRRSVEIGQVIAGFAVVVSGLSEDEPVVVGNTFFLDAERRLSQPAEPGGAMP